MGAMMPVLGSRSIPVSAGEPATNFAIVFAGTVYPRACGGTCSAPAVWRRCWGLSPRLRGNPARGEDASRSGRSIPAPAGEPSRAAVGRFPTTVYPRACGGTVPSPIAERPHAGLSPRLRGNQGLFSRSHPRVYPRACGGTLLDPAATIGPGSIPAPAGEPNSECQAISPRLRGNPTGPQCCNDWTRVYPRACGGTEQ